MQDNKFHPDLDSAFEDKAWQDMRRQLDEEMPVRKKKRRFIFWWWLGSAVAVLILSASMIFMYSSTASKKEHVSSSNKEVINSKIFEQQQAIIKNRPTQEASNQQTILNNTTTSKKSIKEPIKQIPKDNQKKNRKIEKKSLLPIVNFNNSPVQQDTDHFTNPVTNPPTLVTITHAEQVAAPFSPTLDDDFTVNSTPLPLKELPILTKKGISPLPIPIVALEYTSPIISPLRDTIHWQWGLQVALGTFKFNRFNEYSIGILASRQLSPKWRLQTGITYEYLRLNSLNTSIADSFQSLDESSPADNTSGTDSDSGTGGGSFGTTVSSDPNSDPFQDQLFGNLQEKGQIHYLNVPILLAYQLGSNFNINGGANFSYAFKDSYGALGTNAPRLQRWDISAMLGGTYKVSSKLDLQLQYAVGLFEKRKALNLRENNLSSTGTQYSPLEGRIRFSGIWWF